MNKITTIEEVITTLESIISNSESNNDPLGYFAVLYKKVTIKVKEGIEQGYFQDGERMEKLDVIFAHRYLDAWFAFQNNEEITASWQITFENSKKYWPIVLQHLLLGMNAHINLDLGIAAAEVSKNKNIEDLRGDFNKINEILSSLVNEVQDELASIWPTLKFILRQTGKADDFMIDFSLKLARDGAWKFATQIANKEYDDLTIAIKLRDQKVMRKAGIITNTGFLVRIILSIIRLGERGTVSEKIGKMKSLQVHR